MNDDYDDYDDKNIRFVYTLITTTDVKSRIAYYKTSDII